MIVLNRPSNNTGEALQDGVLAHSVAGLGPLYVISAISVSTWLKYLLFQIPGWIITAAISAGLWHWDFIPKWLAILGFFGWVLKDLLLYPFLRRAYETDNKTGSAALVGAKGVAEEHLAPHGYIRVRGELWRAVVTPPNRRISAGTEVEIVKADGMRLSVRAVASDSSRQSGGRG